MNLNQKTLEKLRILINEETEYRSGPQLIKFFDKLGFNDIYGNGFPSRWVYTDRKLEGINGTSKLDKCILTLFNPINYIDSIKALDAHIESFNKYLMFDGWEVYRNNTDVSFRKAGKIILKDSSTKSDINVDEFLQKDFDNLNIDSLGVDQPVIDIIKERLAEIKNCLNSKSPLATIFLCGSTLEGILLGLAIKNIKQFNTSKSAPRHKDGKVKKIHDWTLSSLIDVAAENGFLQKDVKKFSHTLRDFRNYIHPYEQLSEGFNPSDDTSKICWQVLQAAISQISQKSV